MKITYPQRFFNSGLLNLVIAFIFCFAFSSINTIHAQINYVEDFEGLIAGDPLVLGNNGWSVYGNIYDSGGNFLYNYGPFSAPNGGPGFSSLDNAVPGPNGGLQYLNTYNDYNSPEHFSGNLVESNIFQERTLTAADVGRFYTFTFDHQTALPPFTPNPLDPNFQEASAFVKVIDPMTTDLVYINTFDAANDNSWVEGSTLTGAIDGAWEGYILQFGFLSTATNFANTGVYYDNVSFVIGNAIPTLSQWGLISLMILFMIMSVVVIKYSSKKDLSPIRILK